MKKLMMVAAVAMAAAFAKADDRPDEGARQ